MKTINEIQDTIDAVTRQLAEISNELNQLKTSANTAESGINFNAFATIEARAKTAPIHNLALSQANVDAKQTYMRFLSALAGAHEERLLFARRIGLGSGSDWTAERLAAEKGKIGNEFPLEISKNLSGLCNSLLLDSLVMVYGFGTPDNETLDLIALAADILNSGDKDIAVVSKLAAAVVQNDKAMFDNIECEKTYPGLSHLIPKEWIEKPLCEEMCSGLVNENNRAPDGWIEKGEWIFNRVYSDSNSVAVKAPVSGILRYIVRIPDSSTSTWYKPWTWGNYGVILIYHPFYEGPEVK